MAESLDKLEKRYKLEDVLNAILFKKNAVKEFLIYDKEEDSVDYSVLKEEIENVKEALKCIKDDNVLRHIAENTTSISLCSTLENYLEIPTTRGLVNVNIKLLVSPLEKNNVIYKLTRDAEARGWVVVSIASDEGENKFVVCDQY